MGMSSGAIMPHWVSSWCFPAWYRRIHDAEHEGEYLMDEHQGRASRACLEDVLRESIRAHGAAGVVKWVGLSCWPAKLVAASQIVCDGLTAPIGMAVLDPVEKQPEIAVLSHRCAEIVKRAAVDEVQE